MDLTITSAGLPEQLTDDFRALVELDNAHGREILGSDEWVEDPQEVLDRARESSRSHRVIRLLGRLDGVPVGFARSVENLREAPGHANLHVCVLAKHRGRGIGTRLLEALLAAQPEGMTHQDAWVTTPMPGEDDEVLPPPSGIGGVVASHPGIRMAHRLGMRLAQVEALSRYDFAHPAVDPEELLAEAEAQTGADYALELVEGRPDEADFEDLALLFTFASADVPDGELDHPKTVWDVAKVREFLDEHTTDRTFYAFARHRASGRLVAFNNLSASRAVPTASVEQNWTLTHREHRGRGLAKLVKAGNLVAVRKACPEAPSIITWNATENVGMLAVNHRIGFVPIGMEASLQRRL